MGGFPFPFAHSVCNSSHIWLSLFAESCVDCSSLNGNRVIADVFEILEAVAKVGDNNNFSLQEIDNARKPLSNVFQRDTGGNLMAGMYNISELHSIYLTGLVSIVFQSLWNKEQKFFEGV